jgi:hypothetical protein
MIFRNAARSATGFMAALLISGCMASAAPSPASVPARLTGNWVVTSSKVNTAGVAAYLPDDPALLALRLTVSADRLSMDGHTCESPRIASETLPFEALISQTYEASPADMGIASANKDHVTHFITCGKGDIGPGYDRGSWIAEMESDTIAMNWFDSVLLVLKRVGPTGA